MDNGSVSTSMFDPHSTQVTISEWHWMMTILQNIDVGLVVVDQNFEVKLWNGFMENHSGLKLEKIRDRSLIDLFDDFPSEWFKRKAKTVFALGNRAFCTWEQRPYLFHFVNYRPITGMVDFMYQNVTMTPITEFTGETSYLCITVYDVTDIALSKKMLKESNERLSYLSRTDSLTELNNRRFWQECVFNEFMRYRRTKQVACMLLLDIDHFKKVNDTYGHLAGDHVIKNVARIIQAYVRCTDVPGRYGGEEFGVILVGTDADRGYILAERLRKNIESMEIQFEGQSIPCTISAGLATLTDEAKDASEWISQADEALYQAKGSGRNNCKVYQPGHKSA